MRAVLVCGLVVFWASMSTVVRAVVCEKATPISIGAVSTCSGLVVPTSKAAKAIECLRVDLPACEALRVNEVRRCRAEYAAAVHIGDSERTRADRLALELDRVSESVQPPSLWKHPAIWAAVGFVAGAAGTVYLMTSLNDAR